VQKVWWRILREIVRQLARDDRAGGAPDVARDAHDLHARLTLAHVEQHVASARTAILRSPHAPRVHEVHAAHGAMPRRDATTRCHGTMPRHVCVLEADHVTRLRTDGGAHRRQKVVAALGRDVHRVEHTVAMDERRGRSTHVPALRA